MKYKPLKKHVAKHLYELLFPDISEIILSHSKHSHYNLNIKPNTELLQKNPIQALDLRVCFRERKIT